ncbi:MAG: ATP-binding protein [Lachnospiraceae bacterium]|nr:ATP-binding protein [Lachnospiraceae bacterium]
MYREITQKLLKWKDSKRRKPLLLTGVRQCGKTYIVKKFGEKEFEKLVYVNFEANSNYGAIFDYDFDVKRIISELERVKKEKIQQGKTLLFFDEIQECPKAITALKYFCEEMKELHIICAGSLLGVAIKRDSISFPVGKVNRMQLYPMNFKEFLIANNEEGLIETFRDWPIDRAIPEIYSEKLKKYLKDFYIVGGMPEAVQTWIDTGDYNEVDEILNEIVKDYGDDFSKHAPISEVPKIRWIWDSVPVQLAKENNKFIFSHVKAGKRSSELENALQWLKDAGLISIIELVEKPEVPLTSEADKTYFKVYLSDVGLLRVRANISAETIIEETALYIKFKGAFVENYVYNELVTLDKMPYFWRSGNKAEVDFIYEDKNNIIPVEVKSAENTQAKSYRQFCKKYNSKKGYKLSLKNIATNETEGTETISLPLYLTWNIDKY